MQFERNLPLKLERFLCIAESTSLLRKRLDIPIAAEAKLHLAMLAVRCTAQNPRDRGRACSLLYKIALRAYFCYPTNGYCYNLTATRFTVLDASEAEAVPSDSDGKIALRRITAWPCKPKNTKSLCLRDRCFRSNLAGTAYFVRVLVGIALDTTSAHVRKVLSNEPARSSVGR